MDWSDRSEYVRAYLDRGWALFVLRPDKRPVANCDACHSAGEGHDKQSCACLTCHGFYAATHDPERVEAMLLAHPAGVLGVRTGIMSDLTVLDAEGDAEPGQPVGVDVLDAFETWTDGIALPPTLAATTPSGGVHLLYRHVPGARSRNKVLPGVDVKSDGGYVAVPDGSNPRRHWVDADVPVAAAGSDLSAWLIATRGRSSGGTGPGRIEGYDFKVFAETGCPGGFRNQFFNDLAFRLRKDGVVWDAALEQAREHYARAAQPPTARWFMPLQDVEYQLERVWRDVEPDPPVPDWSPQRIVQSVTVGSVSEPEPLPGQESGGREFRSDLGNARRFIRLHGSDLRYLTANRSWLIWDGARWVRDQLDRVRHLATDVPADIRAQALRTSDAEAAKELARWALQSEQARALSAVVHVAAADPRIALTPDRADADAHLLAVRNGVVDLRTGVLRLARREDHLTRRAEVDYDPDAPCPNWREHVKLVTCGDVSLAAYLRRAVGYTLTGGTEAQAFFMLEGSGSNGKSAFMEAILALLGDYAQTGTSALLTGGDEQHPTILADLAGARLVYVDEARQGRPLNVERVKALTGSRRLRARRMGKDFFEFDVALKLWIAGNNHPAVRDPSDGIWRRMHRVIFTAKVPEDRRVGDYGRILYEQEASGILNWALEGLAEYRGLGGLNPPDSVLDAVAEVRAEEDLVGQFISEVCYLGSEWRETTAALYTEFSIWCTLAGVPTAQRVNRVHFGRDLAARGFERFSARVEGRTQRGYVGVGLNRS